MWKETLLPTKWIFGTVAVTFSLWCRKGKGLCERPFALYRQQGRSQDFSKGGGLSYGSKSLEKEKLLVIRIVKEST